MGYIGTKPSAVPLTSADITDGIITSAKIADGTIVNADINASAAIVNSKLSGVGITEADQWRLSANVNSGSNADVTANWERVDSTGNGYVGTGLSQSSGIFSFATTGYYLISYYGAIQCSASDSNVEYILKATIDNSSYSSVFIAVSGNGSTTAGTRTATVGSYIFDVTSTVNCKFKFTTSDFGASTVLLGDTNVGISGFNIIRLGDT